MAHQADEHDHDPGYAGTRKDAPSRFRTMAAALRKGGCHVELLDNGKGAESDAEASFEYAPAIALKRGMLKRDSASRIALINRNARLVNYFGNSVGQYLKP